MKRNITGELIFGLLVLLFLVAQSTPASALIVFDTTFPFIHWVSADEITEYRYIYENFSYTREYYTFTDQTIPAEIVDNGTLVAEHTERVIATTKIVSYSNYGQRQGLWLNYSNGTVTLEPGYFNFDGMTLCEWKVPFGDRNFAEFPCCLAEEKAKGVCSETEFYEATEVT